MPVGARDQGGDLDARGEDCVELHAEHAREVIHRVWRKRATGGYSHDSVGARVDRDEVVVAREVHGHLIDEISRRLLRFEVGDELEAEREPICFQEVLFREISLLEDDAIKGLAGGSCDLSTLF